MLLKNFVVFEGIDGAGTSTQIKLLKESKPDFFWQTAEPTEGETGRFLRRMLAGEFHVNEKTNAYLFAADRCEHIYGKGGIIENIDKGKIAISDRYFFSSLAYQSISCGEEIPFLVNSPFPLPQVLFYFDINPEISLARVLDRAGKSGEKTEIYEKIDLQKKIAAQYEKIISLYESPQKNGGMKIVRIDASRTIQEISEKIREEMSKEFPEIFR